MSMAAEVALILATLLGSLVAGFLFAFAVVVMPGIRNLGDRELLRAFREMDGVIQRGDPLFGLVWVGSALASVAALALGLGQLDGPERVLLALAGGLYLLGVQLPTFVGNIPLNRELQALDIDAADGATCSSARERFEPRWNRWNRVRTVLAVLSSAILMLLLARL
jgi:uncharacterized membrane protein